MNKGKNLFVRAAACVKGALLHNPGKKLLSALLAILLWNYVISNNASITRTKVVTGLTGYISGQTTLNTTYGLAMLDDPIDALTGLTVRVEVSQADFAKVTSDNVQVTLDLSGVRRAGTQEVPLKASTSYGRVLRIVPESLQLTFESMDSRVIPVNVEISEGRRDDYWYNARSNNPTTLTIKGAASLVQSVNSARVYVGVAGREAPYSENLPYVLLDQDGEEISQQTLERSASSVTVWMDVYPSRVLPFSTNVDEVTTGEPEAGYKVEEVTVQPVSITVAGDPELINSLGDAEMPIEPISVEGLTHTIGATVPITNISSFKYCSVSEVYVTVRIVEEDTTQLVKDVGINYVGLSPGLILRAQTETVNVYVTGTRSAVQTLAESGFTATVDLTGLEAGAYDLPLSFPEETYPDIRFTSESNAGQVHVTLEAQPADAGEDD